MGSLSVGRLLTNHLTNPLGYALERPRLSWVVDGDGDPRGLVARVVVALDENFDWSYTTAASGRISTASATPSPSIPRPARATSGG